ncbi:MAG: CHAD domain-containing protein [Beijerinckiaceae bacterium]|nr:CHAD domain-containing protein [Beijerinckiaceae bacterium]
MPEDESNHASTAPAAPAPAREVEVKLEAAPAVLRSAFTLAPFAGATPARAHTFATTYFDTADNALSRAGLALRVRRAGRRRIMTLKWTPRGEAGAFTRGEQEAAVQGDAPEPHLLGPEAAQMIEAASGGAPLEARSMTIFKRRAAIVSFNGAQIEAGQDEGRILAGDRKARIAELELELKGGDPAALFDFAAGLTAFGFRVAAAPKGLRGHWLATGEAPRETRAISAGLSPDAPIDDAIAAILGANLKQFVANWPALSPDCPEAVHQMRVSLRRLRSALGLFNRAIPCDGFTRFREEAKRIASAMGPARDQDVLLDLVEHGPAQALGRDASFDALMKASGRKRAAAYRNVRALIEAPETSRFVLELQAMIARREWRASQADATDAQQDARAAVSAPAFAAQALDRLDKKARRRGKNLVELAPEERHEARIALKNLRYAADFFSPLFVRGRGARKFLRAIGDLQEALGAYNDAIVARSIVADLEQAAGVAAGRAGGAVAGWAARGAADADAHLGAAWKKFRKTQRFWK